MSIQICKDLSDIRCANLMQVWTDVFYEKCTYVFISPVASHLACLLLLPDAGTQRIISFTSPHFPGSLYWLAVHLVRCTSSPLSRWTPTENETFKKDWGLSVRKNEPPLICPHTTGISQDRKDFYRVTREEREFHFHNVLRILEVLKITSLQ